MSLSEAVCTEVKILNIQMKGNDFIIDIEEIKEGMFVHPKVRLKVPKKDCHKDLGKYISEYVGKKVWLKLV